MIPLHISPRHQSRPRKLTYMIFKLYISLLYSNRGGQPSKVIRKHDKVNQKLYRNTTVQRPWTHTSMQQEAASACDMASLYMLIEANVV